MKGFIELTTSGAEPILVALSSIETIEPNNFYPEAETEITLKSGGHIYSVETYDQIIMKITETEK